MNEPLRIPWNTWEGMSLGAGGEGQRVEWTTEVPAQTGTTSSWNVSNYC